MLQLLPIFHDYVDKSVKKGKQNKLSHSNLINKANRQTIEAFLEKNVWKIGVADDKKI